MSSDSSDPEPPARAELEEALRFANALATQNKLAVERVETLLAALMRELEARDVVDSRSVHDRLGTAMADLRARDRDKLAVQVDPTADKHAVRGPDIDCASLLPICKGRCCRLTIHLGHQDLDDGLRFEYARPYELKRDATTNYCTYNVEGGCGIYEKRPATCRSYDCRRDRRIWQDFDRRIPAPISATDRDPALVQIQKARLR